MNPHQLEEAIEQLPTLLDLLRWATSQFNAAGLCYGHGSDNGWDEAKQLLLPGLQLPIDWPTEYYKVHLTLSERRRLISWINRRIEERIPAAYLTQSAWFCGLMFYVDQRVLIPRSPFSELIATRFAGALTHEPQQILELCTGSGCIAIACAYAFPETEIDVVDISADALAVAEYNIQRHGLEQQITPMLSDLFQQLPQRRYDLIIVNPPYVDAEDMANLPAEFHHEPVLGLAAGPDGLALVDPILRKSAAYLSEQGELFCEVGNSFLALQAKYPDLPLQWLPLPQGEHRILKIGRRQLEEYFGQ